MPFLTSCAALCLLTGLPPSTTESAVAPPQVDRLDEIVVLGRREAPRDATLGAGALFGDIDPAGRINMVSKTPRFVPAAEMTAAVGSYGLQRGELDFTGPLSDSLAARLVVAGETSDGWRDHVGTERSSVAPSLTWRPNDDLRLTYVGEFTVLSTLFDRGLPAIDGDALALPVSNYYGEPGDGVTRFRNERHQVTGEYRLDGCGNPRRVLRHQGGAGRAGAFRIPLRRRSLPDLAWHGVVGDGGRGLCRRASRGHRRLGSSPTRLLEGQGGVGIRPDVPGHRPDRGRQPVRRAVRRQLLQSALGLPRRPTSHHRVTSGDTVTAVVASRPLQGDVGASPWRDGP
ncbi:hypothetical protein ACETK8_03530 [Brevundimonas staleyi]|uniref:TonB-dependent receptor n=1 Tax=Brevundimonas staleyi TaxID=74326 RepID=A0ABW0FV85_9CAUL